MACSDATIAGARSPRLHASVRMACAETPACREYEVQHLHCPNDRKCCWKLPVEMASSNKVKEDRGRLQHVSYQHFKFLGDLSLTNITPSWSKSAPIPEHPPYKNAFPLQKIQKKTNKKSIDI